MVTVYFAKVTDQGKSESTVTNRKRTLEWICKLPGGEVILNTAEEVDESLVDGQGRYMPEWMGRV